MFVSIPGKQNQNSIKALYHIFDHSEMVKGMLLSPTKINIRGLSHVLRDSVSILISVVMEDKSFIHMEIGSNIVSHHIYLDSGRMCMHGHVIETSGHLVLSAVHRWRSTSFLGRL
jgi:hypothetical protein